MRKGSDTLMEAGLIEISEEHRGSVIILEKWENREKLRETLRKVFGDIESREEYLEDRDWNKAWTEGFRPLKIADGIWVTAPWHADRIPEEDEKIMIHPGNAFGTGTHESTRLALQQMIRVMRPGFRVLDLGCGSGILSIAARMRGADTVLALDNDPPGPGIIFLRTSGTTGLTVYG
ncbi:MAG: 50S ribosomal protein L11 methyltransferase [Candidatus Marinimicrobia bacterium]|nr:50S ribosomal protein L11 methyltransferase [Candidatus Neomarinimicrobiota bacterium]